MNYLTKKKFLQVLATAFVVGGIALSFTTSTYAHGHGGCRGGGYGGHEWHSGGCSYGSDCPYYNER